MHLRGQFFPGKLEIKNTCKFYIFLGSFPWNFFTLTTESAKFIRVNEVFVAIVNSIKQKLYRCSFYGNALLSIRIRSTLVSKQKSKQKKIVKTVDVKKTKRRTSKTNFWIWFETVSFYQNNFKELTIDMILKDLILEGTVNSKFKISQDFTENTRFISRQKMSEIIEGKRKF